MTTPSENEAFGIHPKVEFRGAEYQLKVSKFTNRMLRHLDQGHVTFILDMLIGEEETEKFIDKHEDVEDMGEFFKACMEVIGSKNS